MSRPDPNALRADPFAVASEPDVSSFKPTPARSRPATREAIRHVSEQNNFPSREAPKPVKVKAQRRRRTGRSVQINIKTTQDTIDQFLALVDRMPQWTQGEAFERAVQALEKLHPAN